jgi:hypothetical protein
MFELWLIFLVLLDFFISEGYKDFCIKGDCFIDVLIRSLCYKSKLLALLYVLVRSEGYNG